MNTPKNIIFSVHPYYPNLIVSGIKTVELRRSFKAEGVINGTALIYATAPEKAIIGYATIKSVKRTHPIALWMDHVNSIHIARADFDKYFEGATEGYAISLDEPVRIKEPIRLSEMRTLRHSPPQSWRYANQSFVDYVKRQESIHCRFV